MDTPRQIRFEFCISFLFFTVRYQSDLVELEMGQSIFRASLPYNLITFFLGWWGIPWGLLTTPVILFRNLGGGMPESALSTEVESPNPAASAESPSS